MASLEEFIERINASRDEFYRSISSRVAVVRPMQLPFYSFPSSWLSYLTCLVHTSSYIEVDPNFQELHEADLVRQHLAEDTFQKIRMRLEEISQQDLVIDEDIFKELSSCKIICSNYFSFCKTGNT